MIEQKKLYNSIDIFKFFAAVLVVAIHTHPLKSMGLDYFFTCFCRIAVPFFFVASSFFFFKKINPDIKAYLKRIFTIYSLWFLIELPIVYRRFFVEYDRPFWLQVLNFLDRLLFNSTFSSSWYLMASAIGVWIVYRLSTRYAWSNTKLLVLSCGAYVLSLLSAGYYRFFDLFLDEQWRSYHNFFSSVFYPANSFIVSLVYICIGKVFAESVKGYGFFSRWITGETKGNDKHTKTWLNILVLFTAIVGVIEVVCFRWSALKNDAWIFLPPLIVLVFLILLRSDIVISSSASYWFRHLSILIYLIHPICKWFNVIILGFWRGDRLTNAILDCYGFSYFFITLMESVVFASLIVVLSKKYKFLTKLY